ncbi:MAG: HD domain-containing protein [Clostridiales bacterium]|nr:HD domain-containing protein [Clostridiales bacterium]
MLINKAIELAAKAHDGQLDKAGKPYIFHPLRVMLNVSGGEYEQCAAVLHDVLEDTDTTAGNLEAEGFPKEIIEAVCLLTRIEGGDYMEYVRRLKSNPIAKAVKLSDLADNMDMSRIKNPTARDFERLEKYKKARAILEE